MLIAILATIVGGILFLIGFFLLLDWLVRLNG